MATRLHGCELAEKSLRGSAAMSVWRSSWQEGRVVSLSAWCKSMRYEANDYTMCEAASQGEWGGNVHEM